jgi:hypothetical protein
MKIVLEAPFVGAIEVETDDIVEAHALPSGGALLQMRDGNCPIVSPEGANRLRHLRLLTDAT